MQDKTTPRLMEFIAQRYCEIFTEQEVEEMIALYSSPIFKKMREFGPQFHAQVLSFVDTLAPEIEGLAKEMMTEFEASRP